MQICMSQCLQQNTNILPSKPRKLFCNMADEREYPMKRTWMAASRRVANSYSVCNKIRQLTRRSTGSTCSIISSPNTWTTISSIPSYQKTHLISWLAMSAAALGKSLICLMGTAGCLQASVRLSRLTITNNRIWLSSLAQQLPSDTEFHAFDISFDQFPHDTWLPDVRRHTYNIFDAPPKELMGKFDIVNVSLVVVFVTDQLIDSVIANITALLKPGGYMQWQDLDPRLAEYPHSHPNFKPQFIQRVIPCAWDYYHLQPPQWISKLEMKMEEAGLTMANSARPSFNPKLLHVSTQLVLMGLDEFIDAMVQKAKLDPAKREGLEAYTVILAKAWKEHQETGASIWVPLVRVVGTKRH